MICGTITGFSSAMSDNVPFFWIGQTASRHCITGARRSSSRSTATGTVPRWHSGTASSMRFSDAPVPWVVSIIVTHHMCDILPKQGRGGGRWGAAGRWRSARPFPGPSGWVRVHPESSCFAVQPEPPNQLCVCGCGGRGRGGVFSVVAFKAVCSVLERRAPRPEHGAAPRTKFAAPNRT